jgi:hypothetical protein
VNYQNDVRDFNFILVGQGRKRALLIGINYFGSPNQLNGCINDVHNIKGFLIQRFGFKEVTTQQRATCSYMALIKGLGNVGRHGDSDRRSRRSAVPTHQGQYL